MEIFGLSSPVIITDVTSIHSLTQGVEIYYHSDCMNISGVDLIQGTYVEIYSEPGNIELSNILEIKSTSYSVAIFTLLDDWFLYLHETTEIFFHRV